MARSSFEQWAKTQPGAYIGPVTISNINSEQRGVVAQKKITQGELLIRIPYELAFTEERVKSLPVIGESIRELVIEKDKLLNSKSILAVGLLYHKAQKNSSYRPWIENLPKEYNDLSIFFGPQEFEVVRANFPFRVVMRMRKIQSLVKNMFEALNVSIFQRFEKEFGSVSYHQFCWAYASVQTRCFKSTRDDLSHVLPPNRSIIFPYCDFLNHSCSTPSLILSDECVKLIAYKDFEEGEEIFISYGARDDESLFLSYGFIEKENPHNQIDLLEEDLNEEVIESSLKFSIPWTGELGQDILSYLDEQVHGNDYGQISLKSKLVLENALRKLLNSYPQSIAEDIRFLSRSDEQDQKLSSLTRRIKLLVFKQKLIINRSLGLLRKGSEK
eukprot:TRINITY_DN4518_c0_g1_i1.p1 TRINITY_DN4518_c0_g1~~TRINITY_DN4518_c0_g1_i1.p1  ORF type:complete len:386 (+),score=56.11 TRINITY_DN4518_c0_g1_i1:62-1219(+)